jgi:hypothetical protein
MRVGLVFLAHGHEVVAHGAPGAFAITAQALPLSHQPPAANGSRSNWWKANLGLMYARLHTS